MALLKEYLIVVAFLVNFEFFNLKTNSWLNSVNSILSFSFKNFDRNNKSINCIVPIQRKSFLTSIFFFLSYLKIIHL